METVFYAALTILLWMLSSSVLLPFLLLLHLNKSFQNMWFSFFFSKVILPLLKHRLIPSRKQGFKNLEEELSGRKKSVPLKILEIGVGDGANLPYYPENSKLTVVDMNPSFQPFFLANKEKYPQVELERIVISMAENMPEVLDNSMDVVVCTYVMCSVVEVASVLREVKRVLKPGGKFLFVEHVAFHDRKMEYMIQRAVSPLWKIYFNGCCPDKDIKSYIDKAGFTNVTSERTLNPSIWLYVRPRLIGIATK